jgi:hemoglobin
MNRTIYCAIAVLMGAAVMSGCGSQGNTPDKDYHTSGSREADQRAEQRVAHDQQIRGKGTGKDDDEKDVKKPLYERLGGEKGVAAIVDDFVNRMLNDPRVNFTRKGVSKGSILNRESAQWDASPANVEQLKKHIAQLIALSTGGPSHYDGREMKAAHAGLKITNAEMDAAIGDLKATLDKLAVATEEQKELMAIVETTRPQVVEER